MSFRSKDPLFELATPLTDEEMDTFSTKLLLKPGQPPVNGHLSGHQNNMEQASPKGTSPDSESKEDSDDNDQNVSSPKRPGWFGKGFAKSRRPAKKRKVR